jgi:hypothetical protein
MKFAQPIPAEVRETLQEMYINHPVFRCRQRAQAIMLSARGFTISQLWAILDVRRGAISEWIDRWELKGWWDFMTCLGQVAPAFTLTPKWRC